MPAYADYTRFLFDKQRAHFYWKRPEYPVRLAAGMNGRIMNCAPGGARLANKVFPVPRLIPRGSTPREPLAAGIGRGKFYELKRIGKPHEFASFFCAGKGNRNPVSSLARTRSTTEPCPQCA